MLHFIPSPPRMLMKGCVIAAKATVTGENVITTANSALFKYAGSLQTISFDKDVIATIKAWGTAGGGASPDHSGGAGGFVAARLNLVAGTYTVIIGQGGRKYSHVGSPPPPAVAYGSTAVKGYSAGGGGLVGIFSGNGPISYDAATQARALAIAGSGGGAGASTASGNGGNAGSPGLPGFGGTVGVNYHGKGGTVSAGGAAGAKAGHTDYPGAALTGGGSDFAASGGSGYYGGGGGGWQSSWVLGGGGGGCNFIKAEAIVIQNAGSPQGTLTSAGADDPDYIVGVGLASAGVIDGGDGLLKISW